MRHTYCREVGIAPAKDNVSFSDFEVLSNGLTWYVQVHHNDRPAFQSLDQTYAHIRSLVQQGVS